jgi:hypothetical protein
MRKKHYILSLCATLSISVQAGIFGLGAGTYITSMTSDGTTVAGYNGGQALLWSQSLGFRTDTTLVDGQPIVEISSISNNSLSYAGILADGSAFVKQGATYQRIDFGTGDAQHRLLISKDGSTVIGVNNGVNQENWVWKSGSFKNGSGQVK